MHLGRGVSSSPFISNIGEGWEKEVGGEASRLTFRVLPFDQMPKAEHFSEIPAVFMNRYVSNNVAHVWADEIWPIFQMLRRTDFFTQTAYSPMSAGSGTSRTSSSSSSSSSSQMSNGYSKDFQLVHSRTQEKYRTWEYKVVHDVVSGEHEPVALASLKTQGQAKVCFKSLWAGR